MIPEIREAVLELLHAVGKLALEEGESWRLDHIELMDSYSACQDMMNPKPPVT